MNWSSGPGRAIALALFATLLVTAVVKAQACKSPEAVMPTSTPTAQPAEPPQGGDAGAVKADVAPGASAVPPDAANPDTGSDAAPDASLSERLERPMIMPATKAGPFVMPEKADPPPAKVQQSESEGD